MTHPNQPHITLTYFDFPGGRGEASRLALHVGGASWTDNRIQMAQWPAMKPTTPFGGLPLLEVAGKGTLCQSNAILGWLGTQYNLLPADAFEAARHIAVLNAVEELRAAANATARDDEDEKRAARLAFAEGYLTRWATGISNEIRGPFVGGNTLSVADLKLFVAMRSYPQGVYDYIPTNVLEPFGKITDLIAAVSSHPKVADWLAK